MRTALTRSSEHPETLSCSGSGLGALKCRSSGDTLVAVEVEHEAHKNLRRVHADGAELEAQKIRRHFLVVEVDLKR